MLLWIDGFDAYGTDGAGIFSALNAAGYEVTGQFGTLVSASANTRTGVGFSLNPASFHQGYNGSVIRNFPLATGLVVGFACQINESIYQPICSIGYNSYLGQVGDQMQVYFNAANGLTVMTGDGLLHYATNPNAFFAGVWQYVEIMYTPGAAGSIQIKVDGVVVLNVTSEQTGQAAYPATVNYFSFNGLGVNMLVDDLYICDQTGPAFNTFLGDCVVHAVLPNADAGTNTFAQFGGDGGGHYTSVDDVTPDGDTSYVYSNTSGQKELYSLSTLPADIVSVLAVGVNVLAKKASAGLGLYQAVCEVGSTESDSPAIAAPLAYTMSQTLLASPPGGGAWSLTSVQSAKIGVKIP